MTNAQQVGSMLPHWSHVEDQLGAKVLQVRLPHLTWPIPGLDWPSQPVPSMSAVLQNMRRRGDKRLLVAAPAPAQTRKALESEAKALKEDNERMVTVTKDLEKRLAEMQRQLDEAAERARANSELPTYETFWLTWPPGCIYGLDRQIRFFGLNRTVKISKVVYAGVNPIQFRINQKKSGLNQF